MCGGKGLTTIVLGVIFIGLLSYAFGFDQSILGGQPSPFRVPLHSDLEMLNDTTGTLTLDEVRSAPHSDEFVPHGDENAPNYSYTNAVVWVRFRLSPPAENSRRLLEIGYPLLDDVTFYSPDFQQGSGYAHSRTGAAHPFWSRELTYRNYMFNLPDTWQADDYFYLRVATKNAMILPVSLWDYQTFVAHATRDYIGLGLYYGVIVMAIAYYLFLFFYVKEIRYLYNATFIFSMALFLFTYNGLAFQYIWPDLPRWSQNLIPLSFFLASATSFFLAASLLPLKDYYPLFNVILKGLSAVTLAMMPLSLLLHDTVAILLITFLSMFGCCLLVAATLLCWLKKYHPARYLFWGWLLFTTGIFILAFRSLGIVPEGFFTAYGSHVGFVGKLGFLGMGLADYQNRILAEQEKMQQRIREQTTEVQVAQTAFLFAQMKPHFLLNALNTISYFVGEKPQKAKGLIVNLSTYLRRTFDFREIPTLVALDDELELVRAYGEIEEARFPGSFVVRYEVDVAPGTRVPPFTIQPLVENALIHGIRGKENGLGVVRVVCRSRNRNTLIAVIDNGAGIDLDTAQPMEKKKTRSGVGLWNIDSRLRNIYGRRLNVRSWPGKGTVIWYKIPIDKSRCLP